MNGLRGRIYAARPLEFKPGTLTKFLAKQPEFHINSILHIVRFSYSPFNGVQISSLVRSWCDLLYLQTDDRKNVSTDLNEAIARLNERRKTRGQAPLVSTPLMVTMVVSVKYSRHELPREKFDTRPPRQGQGNRPRFHQYRDVRQRLGHGPFPCLRDGPKVFLTDLVYTDIVNII